jgi:hypothetical protein
MSDPAVDKKPLDQWYQRKALAAICRKVVVAIDTGDNMIRI